jgi:putative DNA primase/helicase
MTWSDPEWKRAAQEHRVAEQPAEDIRPPAFSDEELALRFAERHGGELRYVAAWGRWLRWDGTRWLFDDTLYAYDLSRRICREVAAGCNKAKVANAIAAAKTVAAIERLAKADRRHAATVDQWDADIWLCNTPGGVIDLHTGEVRPHRPDDYMTRITGVTADARCPTPIWRAFLERVTAGDTELIAFMQRLAGYALTGATSEHALAFLYGTGANGKSTFLNAVTGCAGDYHRAAPIETFTASNSDRHPTDLAGLRGARLVTAIETEEGRRWAESKIKALTGGDRIAARFMRQDFFEYVPQFKLIIAGNHKPGLRSVDEAIRRRFHLIPFTITIPSEERDHDLEHKLRAEWPGILDWMIRGCLEWQRIGLAAPKAVTDATAAYLEAQDAIAAWMDDQCERDPNAWERSAALFANWKAWAERSGEPPGDIKRFRDRIEARGLEGRREPGTGQRGYQGIKLLRREEDEWWK